MPRSAGQKIKLLVLRDYLLANTDCDHAVTLVQMQEHLASCGVDAERKSLYDDLDQLRRCGLDIQSEKRERTTWYRVVSRDFEISELKLLVDAVQGSKFITQKKSRELIGKLETLCSRYEGNDLNRQLLVAGRIKSMNESIYYNVDMLHGAIRDNVQVSFRYFDYNVKKEKVYRKDGARYTVSPFALYWDDENYYLIAYSAPDESIRHYRVDKMADLHPEETAREGAALFKEIDVSQYSRKVFSMFGGEAVKVGMAFAEKLANVVFDRFGKEVFVSPAQKEGFFRFDVPIVPSPQFYGWLFSFGDEAELLYPQTVIDEYKAYLASVCKLYEP